MNALIGWLAAIASMGTVVSENCAGYVLGTTDHQTRQSFRSGARRSEADQNGKLVARTLAPGQFA